MISHDTGYQFVDETQTWESWLKVWAHKGPCVFHCPLLMRGLHLNTTPKDAIILMRRDGNASLVSARRMGITEANEAAERKTWVDSLGLAEPDPGETQTAFKYRVWADVLRPQITAKVYEVEYESLRSHNLWVEDRPNWKWNQTHGTP